MGESAVATFLFVDLVGSTELQQRIGDDANDDLRRSVLSMLRSSVAANGGRVIKSLGDGLMAAFPDSAASAVSCAIAMQQQAERERRSDSTMAFDLRIGLASGEAAFFDDDWSGTPVVQAARLEAVARPNTILATELVQQLVGNRRGLQFQPVGPLDLKGFGHPVVCVEVPWKLTGPELTDGLGSHGAVRRQPATRAVTAIAVLLVVMIVGVGIWVKSSSKSEVVALPSSTTTSSPESSGELPDLDDGFHDGSILRGPDDVDRSGALAASFEPGLAAIVREAGDTPRVLTTDASTVGLPAPPITVDYAQSNELGAPGCLRVLAPGIEITGMHGVIVTGPRLVATVSLFETGSVDDASALFLGHALLAGMRDRECSGWPAGGVLRAPFEASVSRKDWDPGVSAPATEVLLIDSPPARRLASGGTPYSGVAWVGTRVVIFILVGAADEPLTIPRVNELRAAIVGSIE